ncbi:uncharacterized protein LOC142490594 [Ascaphus truei]|uniref:uncharacterized protein LOC142490594 n=1 Tax=Ascaphus truei TaxID=8439 RepID=UPI003F59C131
MEQVSSPGSASSTLLEEHHGDEDDEYDEDDATEETEIQSCDHEEVPIETVVPPNRPSTSTYDAIVASEGKIVDAENRRHSDMMTVLERMIGLQEETVSQLAHLHRVFIEVPKQLQKINTSFEALVVQQTQANYWRMTNVPQFNTSQPGSVHAGQFSPHSSDIHSPGPNVTGQVADIAVQVPDDILPLPSVQIQQQTPTKEATKTKQDTHETDQPSLVQCLPTCSHVSLGTSPVREQSLPKSPVGESLPKSPVGESLPKSPVGESLPKSPVGESLPKSPTTHLASIQGSCVLPPLKSIPIVLDLALRRMDRWRGAMAFLQIMYFGEGVTTLYDILNEDQSGRGHTVGGLSLLLLGRLEKALLLPVLGDGVVVREMALQSNGEQRGVVEFFNGSSKCSNTGEEGQHFGGKLLVRAKKLSEGTSL